MHKIILFFFTVSTLFSASIDTALFEGDNVPHYFKTIDKDIQRNTTHKLKTKDTTALEQSTLSKLKQLYAIKDEIKPFKVIALDKPKVTQELYIQALYHLAKLQNEIQRLEEKKKSIQQKLFALKSSIENTLPTDSNHTLLHNQLQYAFYKISQKKITKSLSLYTKLFSQNFHAFQNALSRVDFKENSAKNIIKHTDKKIDSIQQKNLLLTIDKDSEALRDKKAQEKIINQEELIQKETDSALVKKAKAHVLLALQWIKEKDQKSFFTATESIQKDLETLSLVQKEKFTTILELLIEFGDARFDDTSVALASTEVGFNYIKKSLHTIANKTLFVYQEKAFSIKTILTFAFIIMIGLFIAKLYKNIVNRFRKTNRIKSLSTARLIANSGYYLIIIATFFTALATIGLDMHTIFVVIGAILLWLALGLQGFISNYAMGILIKIDRSIRIGDHVELDENIVGSVHDMDFRSITIETGDHIRFIIPNSRFISGSFINHSLEDNIRRLHIPFSADKEIDYHTIQTKVLDALAKSGVPHLKESNKKAQVIIADINRKIVRYSLLVWIKQDENHDMPIVQSNFLRVVQQSLQKK